MGACETWYAAPQRNGLSYFFRRRRREQRRELVTGVPNV